MDKLALNSISDSKSRSNRKRVGRGTGSGTGKTYCLNTSVDCF